MLCVPLLVYCNPRLHTYLSILTCQYLHADNTVSINVYLSSSSTSSTSRKTTSWLKGLEEEYFFSALTCHEAHPYCDVQMRYGQSYVVTLSPMQ